MRIIPAFTKAIPETIGTVAFCFFPYAKNPRPIAPNTIPEISSDVDSILKFKALKYQRKIYKPTALNCEGTPSWGYLAMRQ